MCVCIDVCVCVCIYVYVDVCTHSWILICVSLTGFSHLFFIELYSDPLYHFSHSKWMEQGEAGTTRVLHQHFLAGAIPPMVQGARPFSLFPYFLRVSLSMDVQLADSLLESVPYENSLWCSPSGAWTDSKSISCVIGHCPYFSPWLSAPIYM